jgi:hypothetical protein
VKKKKLGLKAKAGVRKKVKKKKNRKAEGKKKKTKNFFKENYVRKHPFLLLRREYIIW